MTTTLDSPAAAKPLSFHVVKQRAIARLAEQWDALVPADVPHLRAGMLAAVEAGGMLDGLTYLMLTHGGVPLAAAVVYSLPVDPLETAPEAMRRIVARIRERAPGFMWGSMRVCGSPISNSSSGIYFSPTLSPADRRAAMRILAREVVAEAGINETIYFRDFRDEEMSDYASELANLGFFEVTPPPGMQLDVKWNHLDGYLTALRKRYRQRVRKDMKQSDPLEFTLQDSFEELAPLAHELYRNVLAKADYVLETLTPAFFAAISKFDQAKLLVARRKDTGDVLGVNLLLFGDKVMQNLFIGFDYASNEQYHTYFALVCHSLKLAMERGVTRIELGQDSYEFKARLGAKPYRLTGLMKHRVWPIHFLLRSSRDKLFPLKDAVEHDVFGEGE